jgi:hypothetical protein
MARHLSATNEEKDFCLVAIGSMDACGSQVASGAKSIEH